MTRVTDAASLTVYKLSCSRYKCGSNADIDYNAIMGLSLMIQVKYVKKHCMLLLITMRVGCHSAKKVIYGVRSIGL